MSNDATKGRVLEIVSKGGGSAKIQAMFVSYLSEGHFIYYASINTSKSMTWKSNRI